jgi:hypothetical protein
VDVMLNPMVRCWLHIPGAQNREEFFSRVFTSSGKESEFFYKRGESLLETGFP